MYNRKSLFPNRSFADSNNENNSSNEKQEKSKLRRSLATPFNCLPVKNLEHDGYNWLADGEEISVETPGSSPLQITNSICANKNEISPILKRVALCYLSTLELANQTITSIEFKKMISSRNRIQRVNFNRVTVENGNGTKKRIDEILKELPNLESFEYTFKDNEITFETSQKIAKLSIVSSLRDFVLYELTEDFDFKCFGEFIKKHSNVAFTLVFRCSSEFFNNIKTVKEKFVRFFPAVSVKVVKHE